VEEEVIGGQTKDTRDVAERAVVAVEVVVVTEAELRSDYRLCFVVAVVRVEQQKVHSEPWEGN